MKSEPVNYLVPILSAPRTAHRECIRHTVHSSPSTALPYLRQTNTEKHIAYPIQFPINVEANEGLSWFTFLSPN